METRPTLLLLPSEISLLSSKAGTNLPTLLKNSKLPARTPGLGRTWVRRSATMGIASKCSSLSLLWPGIQSVWKQMRWQICKIKLSIQTPPTYIRTVRAVSWAISMVLSPSWRYSQLQRQISDSRLSISAKWLSKSVTKIPNRTHTSEAALHRGPNHLA